MRFVILSMMFLAPSFVMAQDSASKTPVCNILINGADYKGGVDVKGRPVVPADLNASPIKMPDVITLPLEFDLAERLPMLGESGVNAEGTLGVIDIFKNGRVSYNGEDITNETNVFCGLAEPEPKEEMKAEDVKPEPIISKAPAKPKAPAAPKMPKAAVQKPAMEPTVQKEAVQIDKLKEIVQEVLDVPKAAPALPSDAIKAPTVITPRVEPVVPAVIEPQLQKNNAEESDTLEGGDYKDYNSYN